MPPLQQDDVKLWTPQSRANAGLGKSWDGAEIEGGSVFGRSLGLSLEGDAEEVGGAEVGGLPGARYRLLDAARGQRLGSGGGLQLEGNSN